MIKRLNWIDSAKGIAILLVVLGHVLRGISESRVPVNGHVFALLDNAIYIIHIPIFFLISGYTFEKATIRDGFMGSLKKRAWSLLVPFLIWSWVTAIIKFGLGTYTNTGEISAFDVALYPFLLRDIFWFFWALFLLQTVVSLIVVKRPPTWVYVAIVAIFLTFSSGDIAFGRVVDPALHFIPIFFVGMLLRRWEPSQQPSLALAGCGVLLVLLVEIWVLNSGARPVALTRTLLELFAALGFVVAWAGLFWNRNLSILELLGRQSLVIFVAHVLAASFVRILLLVAGIDNLAVHIMLGVGVGIVGPLVMYVVAERLRLLPYLGLARSSGVARP